MNKKYFKIIAFALFIIFIFILIKRGANSAIDADFSGLVKGISYYESEKNVEVYMNNGGIHKLGIFFVQKDDNVQVGDSLLKKRGEPELYHFKKDSSGAFKLYDVYRHTTFFD